MKDLIKAKDKRSKVDDIVYDLMHTPLAPNKIQELKDMGIELEEEHYTLFLLSVMNQVEGGKTKAFEYLTEIMRRSEIDYTGNIYDLPAKFLAKSFVDLNRMIKQQEYDEYLMGGGRGSAKSSFNPLKIIETMKNIPNIHAFVTRPYANTLRDSVYAQFVWAITEMGDTLNWEFTTSSSL